MLPFRLRQELRLRSRLATRIAAEAVAPAASRAGLREFLASRDRRRRVRGSSADVREWRRWISCREKAFEVWCSLVPPPPAFIAQNRRNKALKYAQIRAGS